MPVKKKEPTARYSRIPRRRRVVEAFHGYGVDPICPYIGFDHAVSPIRSPRPRSWQTHMPAIQQWMGQLVRCGTVEHRDVRHTDAATDGMVSFVHDAVFVRQDDDVEPLAVRLVTTLCMAGEIHVLVCSAAGFCSRFARHSVGAPPSLPAAIWQTL